jgi:diguanylate cyclase (GGDEF)-like protein
VVDVDDFKVINDTRGHLAGDDVLRSIGTVLSTAGRTSDVVGRIGGDEFAVLLPETDRPHAEAAAARLQNAVAELDGERPVSVTIGVGHLHHPDPDATAHRLVAMADVELYEHKHRRPGPGDPRQAPR